MRKTNPREEAATPAGGGAARAEVLVINRDPEVRLLLHKALFIGNFGSTSVATYEEAKACLRRGNYLAVVVCMESPESLEALQTLRDAAGDMSVFAFSRAATPELVREVMRAGADDFIFGTFDARSLVNRLQRVLENRSGGRPVSGGEERRENALPPPSAAEGVLRPVDIICRNEKMRRVLSIAERIASTDSTVLVQGESGTGKELIASWIHQRSNRANGPFVAVNCGALPENLLESQLFGHEKGSFTGAIHRQLGLFEVADGGTIFLDEIGEMGLDMQVKLLRVLQGREFRRIGGSQIVKVDVRVIAASNRDLKEEVEQGRFRNDLFYRLNVITLDLPPLRERREEIPELVESFCERFAVEKGLPRRVFAKDAVERLKSFSWEGNIRELENAVERLVLLSQGEVVESADIDEHLGGQKPVASDSPFSPFLSLDEVKGLHIARVLKETGGNKMRSARILKINVKTLYNLIKNLEIKH